MCFVHCKLVGLCGRCLIATLSLDMTCNTVQSGLVHIGAVVGVCGCVCGTTISYQVILEVVIELCMCISHGVFYSSLNFFCFFVFVFANAGLQDIPGLCTCHGEQEGASGEYLAAHTYTHTGDIL